MKQITTLLFVCLLTAAGAGAHGYVTGRWKPRGEPASYSLPAIAEQCGEWRSEALNSGVGDAALSNLTRKYTHPKSGRVFTVSLTLGPAGLVAQHTPEYCYPGSGYKTVGETQTLGLSDAQAEFRTAVFRKPGGDALRIFWAWSADGKWTSPKVPELSFLSGSLYKLYIVSWEADRALDQDTELQDFFAEVLKSLDQSHFAQRQPQG